MRTTFRRPHCLWLLSLLAYPASARAQFNVPLPAPPSAEVVFRDDMQMLFVDFVDSNIVAWNQRVQVLRRRALAAKMVPDSATVLEADAKRFCAQEPNIDRTKCVNAFAPDTILKRFGSDEARERVPGEVYIKTWIPMYGLRRPKVARYIRASIGDEGLSVIPQFAANISDKEAYIVTSLVRGLIGRGIFSADQAIVVAKSGDPDPTKRDAIESDKANVIRAVNNGGTLVARYTMPMYAATGATASRAAGLAISAGVIGPITESDAPNGGKRTGSGSGAFEGLVSFPIRSFGGTSEVLADLIMGARIGYTYSGRPLLVAGGAHDVAFGQIVLGLRQNGALSASALITFANNGMNDLIPRLGLNLAARR